MLSLVRPASMLELKPNAWTAPLSVVSALSILSRVWGRGEGGREVFLLETVVLRLFRRDPFISYRKNINFKAVCISLWCLITLSKNSLDETKQLEIRDSQNLAKLGLGAEFLFIY